LDKPGDLGKKKMDKNGEKRAQMREKSKKNAKKWQKMETNEQKWRKMRSFWNRFFATKAIPATRCCE
jgi:hypothetical protein